MTQFSKTVLETQETKEESAASGLTKVADGVFHTKIIFVGAYFVDTPADGWVLIDTGLPMSDGKIRRAAENHYGANSKPSAIILTHGHFDHAGAALALAEQWNISIYAHRLEMPYLTGKSDYPLGLYDLDRKIRPVGEAYRRLISDWGAMLPTGSYSMSFDF